MYWLLFATVVLTIFEVMATTHPLVLREGAVFPFTLNVCFGFWLGVAVMVVPYGLLLLASKLGWSDNEHIRRRSVPMRRFFAVWFFIGQLLLLSSKNLTWYRDAAAAISLIALVNLFVLERDPISRSTES